MTHDFDDIERHNYRARVWRWACVFIAAGYGALALIVKGCS